jgi:hypothetical protein
MPKDKQKLQLRKCVKCNIEEFKTEVCKHCKFFNPNSIMTPIPAAGLTDQGYCFKHRTLYAETQPACIQFIKFITKWRALGEKLDELNLWKRKAETNNKKHKFNGDSIGGKNA